MGIPGTRVFSSLVVCACLALLAQAIQAAPPNYRLTRLVAPDGWSFQQFPTITNTGEIVGLLYNSDKDIQHVYSYKNGVLTDITPDAGDAVTRATTINEAGHMVVVKSDDIFLYVDGQLSPLVFPGYELVPRSMNNSDQIVGDAVQPNVTVGHSFLYDGGGFTILQGAPFGGW